jgi:hypothetical protein
MSNQVKAFIDHGQALYKNFDGVSIDPTNLHFSLTDAIFQAFAVDPNVSKDEARVNSKKWTKNINARLKRKGGGSTKCGNETFLPYQQICRELMNIPELEVFPTALVQMSVHVLCPSPTFILALMCRIREVAEGGVNMVLIQSILGARKDEQFSSYLAQIKEWNSRNQLCQDEVGKNKKRKSVCGKRVNLNKAKCSYHLHRIKD